MVVEPMEKPSVTARSVLERETKVWGMAEAAGSW